LYFKSCNTSKITDFSLLRITFPIKATLDSFSFSYEKSDEPGTILQAKAFMFIKSNENIKIIFFTIRINGIILSNIIN
jgi:hypothetical protein